MLYCFQNYYKWFYCQQSMKVLSLSNTWCYQTLIFADLVGMWYSLLSLVQDLCLQIGSSKAPVSLLGHVSFLWHACSNLLPIFLLIYFLCSGYQSCCQVIKYIHFCYSAVILLCFFVLKLKYSLYIYNIICYNCTI